MLENLLIPLTSIDVQADRDLQALLKARAWHLADVRRDFRPNELHRAGLSQDGKDTLVIGGTRRSLWTQPIQHGSSQPLQWRKFLEASAPA